MASSEDAAQMQWLKNNRPLEDKLADRVNISSDERRYSLEIHNVISSDSGLYTAKLKNSSKPASCTAQLVVEDRESETVKIYYIAHTCVN